MSRKSHFFRCRVSKKGFCGWGQFFPSLGSVRPFWNHWRRDLLSKALRNKKEVSAMCTFLAEPTCQLRCWFSVQHLWINIGDIVRKCFALLCWYEQENTNPNQNKGVQRHFFGPFCQKLATSMVMLSTMAWGCGQNVFSERPFCYTSFGVCSLALFALLALGALNWEDRMGGFRKGGFFK